MIGIIHLYRLHGDKALPIKDVRFVDKSREELLDLLCAVRAGLPADCGASLVDERGYPIRP